MVGDHKQAKGVFDFDSVHLIQCCKKMNQGTDWAGNELDGATDFFVGAVVTPEARSARAADCTMFARKVEAGADFFQTQAVFDMDKLPALHGAGARDHCGYRHHRSWPVW
jgi:5,10-methylenetetrahydrofolate reductase